MCSLLVLAAACPSEDELKAAFEEDDAGAKDEDGPARAGRGGAGQTAGKGGSLQGSAGKGVAGSAMLEDPPEDGPQGAAGSASPGSAGSAAAGRGASAAAGSGGAGSGAGRAGSGAAGRGTIGGGQAGSSAAGSGSAGSAGRAGSASGSNSIPGSTTLAAITTDSQAEALCDLLRAKVDPRDFDTLERGSCTLEGLTGELQGQGECTALVQQCLNSPVPAEPPVRESCTAADVPRCTNVSVDEYVACSLASIESSSAFFGSLTCSTDLTTIRDLPTPEACVGPYQRCPELTSGSEDDGA